MDTIILNHDARHKPAAFVNNPGTLRLGDAEISGIFPPLCRPDRIIADPGSLRLGDAEVSAQLPCL
jgi:hypothetical protein